MIEKILFKTQYKAVVVLTMVLLIISCTSTTEKVDVSEIKIEVNKQRLDKDLFQQKDSVSQITLDKLRKEYGTFFDLYTQRIIHLPPADDSLLTTNLNGFVNDKDVQDIYKRTHETFKDADVNTIYSGVEDFLKHYKYYFKKQPVQGIVTFISAFNYNIITTDSIIGIGLDMYLGKDCPFYPSINFPMYMYNRFSKEYIVNDCIKGWFQSEYDIEKEKKEMLSQMIYYGKQMYFTDMMAPEINDTIKTGYTQKQLDWCTQNQEQMWGFYIEKKLLYSTEEKEYMKFLSDGNTTQGFPEGSPAKTGQWLGWQIVKAYMKNNDVTLQQLLNEHDAQKILQQSGYKPK